MLRGWVDDESAFDKLIELYEEKEEGSPLFAFEVTMQNHGGYSKEYEDLTNEIQFSDAGEDLRSVHQVQIEATEKYLTLIKKTDEAFENLIDYFQDEDEKTIILMCHPGHPEIRIRWSPVWKLLLPSLIKLPWKNSNVSS